VEDAAGDGATQGLHPGGHREEIRYEIPEFRLFLKIKCGHGRPLTAL
jgi:hypothetical protein